MEKYSADCGERLPVGKFYSPSLIKEGGVGVVPKGDFPDRLTVALSEETL